MSSVKETYSSSELAAILGVHISSIRRRAKAENWRFTQRPERLGGNAYQGVTLPADVKAAIAKQLADAEPKRVLPARAVIPDWSHKFGLARYQIVAGWRSYCARQKAKGVNKGEATAVYLTAYNAGQLAKDAFAIVGQVKKSSLYRWEELLRTNGDDYYSICDRRGKWSRGEKKSDILSPAVAEAFLACWLNPNRPSVTLAYRAVEAALTEQGVAVPSFSSFRRFAERYDGCHHDIVVLKREGEKALKDKVMPYIKRASSILKVGDCLFADGHTLNFQCLHPETGKPFRPTLLLWYDWASGMPVGWDIMPTENTIVVSSALRMAIKHLGKKPGVAYLDNGKAFKNKYFREIQPDFESLSGLYARLGIGLQFAMPYNARAKVVERFFRTFNEQFERLVPSYIGQNIDDKPAHLMRNEKYHAGRQAKRAFIPTLAQAMEMFSRYVHWFAGRPHSHGGGKTHGEVFTEGQGPGVDMADLDHHFLWSKKVRPTRTGFTLAKQRYESDSLYEVHQEIIIRWSWADLSEIYVYDLDGEYLGKALPQVEIHPLARHFGSEHDQAMVADANRRLASLKKKTMGEARRLDKALDQKSGLQAIEYLSEWDVVMDQVEDALSQAKLDGPKDQRPGFSTEGYMPARVEPPAEPEPVYGDLTEEEKARLEALSEKAVSDAAAKPTLERPDWFVSEYEKYDWLFMARFAHGLELSVDDLAFMQRYEASDEYKRATGFRYEDLKKYYGFNSHNGGKQ